MLKTIITEVDLNKGQSIKTEVVSNKRIPIPFRKIGEGKTMDSLKLLAELTPQEARVIIKLRDNLCVEDNTTFISTFGLTRYQKMEQRKGVNRLKDKDIIKETKRGHFIFNPHFMVPNGDVFKQVEQKYQST